MTTDESDRSEESEPQVPVVCPECETETRIALSALEETVERHNRERHDGEEIARVDPELADQLADLVAEELGLL